MKTKLKRFLEVLENYGEYFFSCGNVKQDYDSITSVLSRQGYWSGTRYRFYFDNELNLLDVEERW